MPSAESADERLVLLGEFGSNPGALQAWEYVPKSLPADAPLVVVLHGCTQTAGGYNRSSNWSRAADEYGFALLFPEQRRSNNPNLCFNWFLPEDASRGRGEALSIRQMVAAMQERHSTDPKRVYVNGLSAGGAMTAVLLATYPEVFAGGAIIAGLPFGTAHSVPQAFDRMRGHGIPSATTLGAMVRSASGHSGPWPILSVWHGSSDATVDPRNATAIVEQWGEVHGVDRSPSGTDISDGNLHRVWNDSSGRPVIEEHIIGGMGHGTPLDPSGGFGETSAPFMLDVGLSATRRMLAFWEIAGEPVVAIPAPPALNSAPPAQAHKQPSPSRPPAAGVTSPGVQKTIEDALRAAGLMR